MCEGESLICSHSEVATQSVRTIDAVVLHFGSRSYSWYAVSQEGVSPASFSSEHLHITTAAQDHYSRFVDHIHSVDRSYPVHSLHR